MSDSHGKALAVVERKDIERMHPVVALAMRGANAPDPQMMRELLSVQREYEAGEALKAYTRALVELKRDLPSVIARDKEVKYSGVHFTHASLAGIMEAVTPHLSRYGFSLGFEPSTDGDKVTVICRLTHSEGHSGTATLTAAVDTKGNKSPAQSISSTITQLQRYTALSILGIATADMEDGDSSGASSDGVDVNRNVRVLGVLIAKYKRTKDAAVAFVGRPVELWTSADVDRVKAWAKGSAETAQAGKDPQTGVEHPEAWDAIAEAGGV